MKILFFDTETTGLPLWKEPSDHADQPHVVDLAVDIFDTEAGTIVHSYDTIINCGVAIPPELTAIHGIDNAMMEAEGVDPDVALVNFMALIDDADMIAGHNVSFDIRMMRILAARVSGEKWSPVQPTYCTMRKATNICKILGPKARHDADWKWPTLAEAIQHFYGEELEDAHRARPDCEAARRVYLGIMQQKDN